MRGPDGGHAGGVEPYVVLCDRNAPHALRKFNLTVDGALVAHKHARNAPTQGAFRLIGRGDVEVASVALLEVYELVLFQRLGGVVRRLARHLGAIMAVRHGLEARGCRRGRRGGLGGREGGEDARSEAARDAEAGVLPELLGDAEFALGEEHDEDAEGVGYAVLHDAGGDVARGQECAACFGGFAGGEEQRALVLRAEFLFQEGGELRGRTMAMRRQCAALDESLTFLMVACMKKRGYPVCMASATRASPSSYPTLSAHFGSETEMACSVKAGIGLPRGIRGTAIVLPL